VIVRDPAERVRLRGERIRRYFRAGKHRLPGGDLKCGEDIAEDLGVSWRLLMRRLREAGCVDVIHEFAKG
jgi:hypothetical protein